MVQLISEVLKIGIPPLPFLPRPYELRLVFGVKFGVYNCVKTLKPSDFSGSLVLQCLFAAECK